MIQGEGFALKKIGVVISDLKAGFLSLEENQKRPLALALSSLFLILFSYPIIRSTVTAIFLNDFGAEKTPLVWLFSIIGLTISITFYNKFQVKLSLQKLFLITAILSFLFFAFSILAIHYQLKWWAYPLFVWKEIYIVLLVHLTLGYINSVLREDQAKVFYGPFGAISSFGGILGGLLTSSLTYSFKSPAILFIGSVVMAFSGIIMMFTSREFSLAKDKDHRGKESPLHSINQVKKYVFLISLMILLSQFVINLANFKFNLLFNELVTEQIDKTRTLGQIYAAINFVSLIFQIVVIPLTFQFFHIVTVHKFIPIFYGVIAFLGLYLGSGILWPVAISFILFKGIDYSLFSASKEILYFPLDARQRYGAKYISDMVVYRLGKGLISLLLVFFQGAFFVNTLLALSLGAWLLGLVNLKSENEKLHRESEQI